MMCPNCCSIPEPTFKQDQMLKCERCHSENIGRANTQLQSDTHYNRIIITIIVDMPSIIALHVPIPKAAYLSE